MASSGHMGYLGETAFLPALPGEDPARFVGEDRESGTVCNVVSRDRRRLGRGFGNGGDRPAGCRRGAGARSEEHTSELQSLMRSSYDVFCLKKKKHMYEMSEV